MNYYGEVYEICDEPSLVYETLKLAMQRIDKLFPFRGPKAFSNGALSYSNRQTGNLYAFSGYEYISKKGTEIYSLNYHGGSLVQHT
jgi:hypothetical protein